MNDSEIDQIKSHADAYMHGWKKGWHNGSMAERVRIVKLLQVERDTFDKPLIFNYPWALNQIIEQIKEEENDVPSM